MEEAGSGKSVTTLFWIRCIPVPPGRIAEGESLLDDEPDWSFRIKRCARFRIPLYRSRHPKGSFVQGIQFYLRNPG